MRLVPAMLMAIIVLLASQHRVRAEPTAAPPVTASGEATTVEPPTAPGKPLTRGQQKALQAYRGGCPVVCAQHEACVHHRCVDMCRPDCRAGTYCTAAGTCQAVAGNPATVLTEAERQRLSGLPSKNAHWLVFVDIGGALGYGVRPGIEYGKLHSFLFRLHLLNTGILSHAAFVENEYERFDWGFGASAGYRRYVSTWGNLRGFYYGGGLDYSVSYIESRGSTDLMQLVHTAAPYGEFGYRWVFGSFALGFGPTLALRYPIYVATFGSDRHLCSANFTCQDTARRIEGTVNLELGWFQ